MRKYPIVLVGKLEVLSYYMTWVISLWSSPGVFRCRSTYTFSFQSHVWFPVISDSCLARTCSLNPGLSGKVLLVLDLPRAEVAQSPSPAQDRAWKETDGDVRRSWLCPLLMLGLAGLKEFLRSSPSPLQAVGGKCWTAGQIPICYCPDLLHCLGKGGSVFKLRFIALAKLGWQCWL